MDNTAEVEMVLTPDMEKTLMDFFNIELEIMQGSREQLPDGRCKIKITVSDHGKAEIMKEFALKMISQSHKQNLS